MTQQEHERRVAQMQELRRSLEEQSEINVHQHKEAFDDLLEACKIIVSVLDRYRKDAIAKATGQEG